MKNYLIVTLDDDHSPNLMIGVRPGTPTETDGFHPSVVNFIVLREALILSLRAAEEKAGINSGFLVKNVVRRLEESVFDADYKFQTSQLDKTIKDHDKTCKDKR